MSADEKKRMGRPPKSPHAKKTTSFTFRTRATVRKALEDAADQKGWTATEEVEQRVERSVDFDQRAFGRESTFRLMVAFAQALRSIEEGQNVDWERDTSGVVAMRMKAAVGDIMEFHIALRAPATAEEHQNVAGELFKSVADDDAP